MSTSRVSPLHYLLLVGVPAIVLALVLWFGPERRSALDALTGTLPAAAAELAPSVAPAKASAAASVKVGLLVAQLLVVLIAARATGYLLERIGQPSVIGEMLAGILLGPSILGALLPEVSGTLFPADSLGFLSALSQLGVLMFLFLVGLHLDLTSLRRQAGAAVIASHASIAAPFTMGVVLAIWLYPKVAPPDVPFAPFALFVGAAMSVTAFPVLARILEDKGLTRTPLGGLAIACAAVDDVTAWCLLAAVVALVRAQGVGSTLLFTLGGSLLFVILMLKVMRPMLARLAERPFANGRVGAGSMGVVIVTVLASALVTEWLGIHALFGAFLAGVVMPRANGFTEAVAHQLSDLLVILLLPLFFAYTGLRTRFDLIAAGDGLLITVAVLVVAVSGKIGGTAFAARLSGQSWRDASALGVLMNTRGLMELVVLHMGLDLGVISPALFAMMVVMALVTTVMTAPLLSLVRAPSLSPSLLPADGDGRMAQQH
ncbi:MAG TPA: cation:proton antiporter [Gemmatimonas sp.]|uniref:cation:proton antiporter n=1 Tax=Gemmatimonas sp. TaxID=1962908 RepID=UPI002EDA8059